MSNPIFTDRADSYNFNPNNLRITYCNTHGLDPNAHYVDSVRDKAGHVQFSLHERDLAAEQAAAEQAAAEQAAAEQAAAEAAAKAAGQ